MRVTNKASHIVLGRIIYQRLEHEFDVQLDKECFLLGNILPDIIGSYLVKPHLFKNYHSRIKKRIQKLLNEKKTSAYCGKSFSRKLGVICHYYADFFCHPHNEKYTGDFISHVRYEKELFQYLSRGSFISGEVSYVRLIPEEVNTDFIFGRLSALYDAYIGNKPSFYNDIVFSLKACTEALVFLTSTDDAEQMSEYELCYPF